MRVRGRGSEPLCPFCGELFKMPKEIRTNLGNVFSGGKCSCGAAYVYDRTGRSLGEAYVDGLVYACNEDWEKAWTLIPDEDYNIVPMCYDEISHAILDNARQGGRVRENLLFIRLRNKDLNVLKGEIDKQT